MQRDDTTRRVSVGRKAHRLQPSGTERIAEENLPALVIADTLHVRRDMR